MQERVCDRVNDCGSWEDEADCCGRVQCQQVRSTVEQQYSCVGRAAARRGRAGGAGAVQATRFKTPHIAQVGNIILSRKPSNKREQNHFRT